jgi:hypothetical protein
MPGYPKLKTGSIAQYPSVRETRYRTRTLQFVDGTEQTYPMSGQPQNAWQFLYSNISDTEARRIQTFVTESKGRHDQFSIENPWTGQVEDNWRLESDVVEFETTAEGRVRTRLPVVEE